MFLDSAKIVSLTQQLHSQLKPEPSSRYTWLPYSLIEFLICGNYFEIFPEKYTLLISSLTTYNTNLLQE